ncbi:hypothetical protein B0H66DRAFT_560439 [Apodospora peruviana]|uniref:Delta(24)-sterol reductase n=1 Tax=Apodospora peruviana TaxID=516989 RepID=A0AAE0M283_9PEZI|nr:hypothetical protein B0H66DRAFT_560439 [Apodospora peruviana]
MEQHAAKVARIASAARGFFERHERYRIFHGSTNSTRPRPQSKVVDISDLRDVLSVDASRRVAVVEPNVPMDKLVEATLPHGLVPPVVMEFPGITAGGGFAGTAGESSSFRHGFFDDTVNRVEMVLGDGKVIKASRDEKEHPRLFRCAAGAVGTLGTTTLLEVKLMKARKYVRTRYRRTSSVAEAVAAVEEEVQREGNDYVDGILFSKGHGVIVTGQLTDEKPDSAKAQKFSGAWDPWFYLHARDRTASVGVAEDYIPLPEYLFRYDRGGFWVGTAAFEYFKGLVPFNRFTRWFLDDFLHTRMLYRALHASGEDAKFLVQDIAMPFETAEKFVDYTAEQTKIWPLWLCPLQRRAPPTFHPFTTPSKDTDTAAGKKEDDKGAVRENMMLNIGLWGWGPSTRAEFIKMNREVEKKVRELGGMKWLYAHTYYEQKEFFNMYGSGGPGWYFRLRGKYRAMRSLPTVWEKVHVSTEISPAEEKAGKEWKRKWPIAGFYGIYKSIKSGDYWLHRNAKWNKWKE